jgi:hypothetical protein
VSSLLCAPGDVSIGDLHGVGCADAYRTAEVQQAAQPLSGPARRLATHMMSEFFSQPLLDGKLALRLVVDNDPA